MATADDLTEFDWQMAIHRDPSTEEFAWTYGAQSIDEYFGAGGDFWQADLSLGGGQDTANQNHGDPIGGSFDPSAVAGNVSTNFPLHEQAGSILEHGGMEAGGMEGGDLLGGGDRGMSGHVWQPMQLDGHVGDGQGSNLDPQLVMDGAGYHGTHQQWQLPLRLANNLPNDFTPMVASMVAPKVYPMVAPMVAPTVAPMVAYQAPVTPPPRYNEQTAFEEQGFAGYGGEKNAEFGLGAGIPGNAFTANEAPLAPSRSIYNRELPYAIRPDFNYNPIQFTRQALNSGTLAPTPTYPVPFSMANASMPMEGINPYQRGRRTRTTSGAESLRNEMEQSPALLSPGELGPIPFKKPGNEGMTGMAVSNPSAKRKRNEEQKQDSDQDLKGSPFPAQNVAPVKVRKTMSGMRPLLPAPEKPSFQRIQPEQKKLKSASSNNTEAAVKNEGKVSSKAELNKSKAGTLPHQSDSILSNNPGSMITDPTSDTSASALTKRKGAPAPQLKQPASRRKTKTSAAPITEPSASATGTSDAGADHSAGKAGAGEETPRKKNGGLWIRKMELRSLLSPEELQSLERSSVGNNGSSNSGLVAGPNAGEAAKARRAKKSGASS